MNPQLAESWRSRPEFAATLTLLDSISTSGRLFEAVKGSTFPSVWHPPSPTPYDRDTSPLEPSTLQFIDSLQIPQVGGLDYPVMQLHRLGSFATEDELRQRKEDIFSGDDSFLVNTTGTGKTRLLFEGLCDEWGFYFTSFVDSSFLGSFDVQKMVDRLEQVPGFGISPCLISGPESAQDVAFNIQFARAHSIYVLLARLLLFTSFLDCATSLGGDISERKRSWLHLQLRQNLQTKREHGTPRLLDASLELYEALSRAKVDDTVLASVIMEISAAIVTRLGKNTKIFIVLDEANVAAKACTWRFRDDNGNYYPLLKVMVKTWRDLLQGMPFIFVVAGTDIAEEHFVNDVEWRDFVWKSNTGEFDTADKQRRYVQQFMPCTLRESAGDPLMRYMWRWTRGRHRFTTACILVLLVHGYVNPLSYLNMVIYRVTGYLPHDADFDVGLPRNIIPYDQLDFRAMEIDRRLRSHVHLAMIDALISLSNPGFPKNAIKLVDEGIGRFKDSRCSHIVVDEPFVIARAVTWFTSSKGGTPASILNYQYFVKHLVDPDMEPRHPPAYLALALALSFGKIRCISDILLLSRPAPSWSKCNANIVAQTLRCGHTLDHAVRDVAIVHQTLVTYSTSMSDTLSWLRHSHPTPFCIHVTDTAAILIFIIRLSNGSRFWVFMQTLYSFGDHEDVTARVRETLHGLQPKNLFRRLDAHETPSSESDIFSALDSLPNPCPQVGPHGVLPVVAVIGKDVEQDILAAPGLPRAALLNLGRAIDITPTENVAERIISAVTREVEVNEIACSVSEKENARAVVSDSSPSKHTRFSSGRGHDDGNASGPSGRSSVKPRPWR